ncbi:MAG: YihY/virulence factor BrkB family protein [Actinomycetota bacterium]
MAAMARWLARVLIIKGIVSSLGRNNSPERRSALAAGVSSPAYAGRSPAPRGVRTSRAGGSADQGIAPQRSGEPGPDSPLDLEPTDWKSTLKRTAEEIKDDRMTLAAAGMAYYFFLAVFPAIIAAVGVLALIDVDVGAVVESIRTAVPGSAGQILVDAVNNAESAPQGGSLIAAIAGIAVALWSASSGMVALQSGLNIAYDVPKDRKFIGKRMVAFALLIATGVLGGVPSPIFTFGESTIFVVLGWVLTVIAVIVLFSVFYFLGPNRDKPSWRWVSPGGFAGALLWLVASAAFGLYLAEFGETSYSETYGSIAGVVALILWLFLTSLSVLVGGELNAEVERQGEAKTSRQSG